jgi:epoxide hydrolase-like predicted phosphatase
MENIKPTIRAVIFDMGGVILRTEDLSSRTKLAAKFGLTCRELEDIIFQSPDSVRAELGEFTREEHWKNMAGLLKFPESELDEFQRAYWEGDAVDKELETYIRGLRPRYKTGLLSNAWEGTRLDAPIRGFTFLEAFDETVFSWEVRLRKPDPRIYRLLLERLGVQPQEAVFVDDFMKNIEGAQDVGMHTVWFKGREDAVRQLRELGVV